MFTTGNHIYLYIAVILYTISLVHFLKFRYSFIIFLAGFIINSLYVVGRAWTGGVFIMNNAFDSAFFLPWCLSVIIILIKIKRDDDSWAEALIPLLLFSLIAVLSPKGVIASSPSKITSWTHAFFLTENFAHACFYCGALFAIITLTKGNNENSFHAFLVWGFVLYSIAQVTGAIWCYKGWGNTFNWSNRHMSSAAIWLFYAAYLHLRYLSGWHFKRKCWYAIIGAVIIFAVSLSGTLKEMHFPRIGG